jgi:hypothetical protein
MANLKFEISKREERAKRRLGRKERPGVLLREVPDRWLEE